FSFQISGNWKLETRNRNLRQELKKLGHAFFHYQYSILNSGGFGLFFQESERFLHGFVREAESSVVHGDHPARVEVKKGAGSGGGAGMDVAERRRIVSSDRQ